MENQCWQCDGYLLGEQVYVYYQHQKHEFCRWDCVFKFYTEDAIKKAVRVGEFNEISDTPKIRQRLNAVMARFAEFKKDDYGKKYIPKNVPE